MSKKCVIGKTVDQISVGDKAYFAKTISESDIVQYSGITGDVNPIAVDATFASKTRYKKRIAHGMLIASFFSNIVGTKLPGPGSIHVSYKVRFEKPVFIGDTVETKVEVTSVNEKENTIDVVVESINQDGVVVLSGSGVISPPLPAYCI